MTGNTIDVSGQYGMYLYNFYCCLTAKQNTVVGSIVGIYLGGGLPDGSMLVTHNSLLNNGTGIFIYGDGDHLLENNLIVQSSAAAIDANCSNATVEHNTISGSPVGVANVALDSTVKKNTVYNVTNPTTACTTGQ